MKTLDLFEKSVTIRGVETKLTSRDILMISLEAWSDGLKGLKNISLTQKVWEKLNNATTSVTFEDAEFSHLFAAVEAVQTIGPIVAFPEFVNELLRVKDIK